MAARTERKRYDPGVAAAVRLIPRHGLRAGDLVRVRTEEEILRTLDADGRLEGVPFMPEMLRFCGREFRVRARAHKVCDTIEWDNSAGWTMPFTSPTFDVMAPLTAAVRPVASFSGRRPGSAQLNRRARSVRTYRGRLRQPMPRETSCRHGRDPVAGDTGGEERGWPNAVLVSSDRGFTSDGRAGQLVGAGAILGRSNRAIRRSTTLRAHS